MVGAGRTSPEELFNVGGDAGIEDVESRFPRGSYGRYITGDDDPDVEAFNIVSRDEEPTTKFRSKQSSPNTQRLLSS